MKKLLFIYPHMMLGGSTTSLLSVLNCIDYKNYAVDIVFYDKQGELYEYLPEEVNVLPLACKYPDIRKMHIRKLFSIKSIMSAVKGRFLSKKKGSLWIEYQLGAQDNVRYCNEINEYYDMAISFLEFWPLYYLANSVKAKRKIAWIHTDYSKLNLLGKYEDKTFSKIDKVVLISNECKNKFISCLPQWKDKAMVVENFVSEKLIKQRSEEEVDFQVDEKKLNFITTCRIDFESKGLDRAVDVIERLKREGYTKQFHWYIIGSGADEDKLAALLEKKQLADCITLLGRKNNPFPYERLCDVFFLPSYFEGKPIAVTEAQILSLVPIVTNYSSAMEQVEHMKDGIILKNEENAIYEGLKEVLNNPQVIGKLKLEIKNRKKNTKGEEQWKGLLEES